MVENASSHAQAGADVRDQTQEIPRRAAAGAGSRDHRRSSNNTASSKCLQDGFGFLRSPDANYLPGPDDIYISPSQIRRFSLKTGDTVEGRFVRRRKASAISRCSRSTRSISKIPRRSAQGPLRQPDAALSRRALQDGNRRSDAQGHLAARHRYGGAARQGPARLIVAPPRTGKTVLLQNIAHSITANHPECYLIVLLIDERPEEVTDMQRSVKGEVVSSTFDEPASVTSRSPKW
jgi:transcription termination factor Rho